MLRSFLSSRSSQILQLGEHPCPEGHELSCFSIKSSLCHNQHDEVRCSSTEIPGALLTFVQECLGHSIQDCYHLAQRDTRSRDVGQQMLVVKPKPKKANQCGGMSGDDTDGNATTPTTPRPKFLELVLILKCRPIRCEAQLR